MNKIQAAVEDFEGRFECLVDECLDDIDLDKAVDYFSDPNLFDVAQSILEERDIND